MKWRPWLFAFTGLLWLVVAIGRYSREPAGFLTVVPFVIAAFNLLAAALWWTNPKPRQQP